MPRATTQPHPLAAYTAQIIPGEIYTLRRIAGVLGMATTSVNTWVAHGLLPGSRIRPHARGGRERVWTGKQLLRIAQRPVRVAYDHARFAPTTLYRVGCRCTVCTAAHTAESTERRRALAEAAFTAEQRRRLLELVGTGTAVAAAAERVGVTIRQVYGRANWDAEFGEALDEAAWALCLYGPDSPQCSTAGAYRGDSHGTTLRPACRGTGCREWRRGSSQQERAMAAAAAE